MTVPKPWPQAELLTTSRLRLEPLSVGHAEEAYTVFNDARLHTWTGGRPPVSLEQLEKRYRRQAAGQAPDGSQGWLNLMLRPHNENKLLGTVQATIRASVPGALEAELAWVIGTAYQGNGYGSESALALATWLRKQGVDMLRAHIHPGHTASNRIAHAIGLTATSSTVDGETRWTDSAT